jgi:hypothetical protein
MNGTVYPRVIEQQKMKQSQWAVVRAADRCVLIELENKEQAFDCAASLRRLNNLAVHVEPLFASKSLKVHHACCIGSVPHENHSLYARRD